MTVIKGYNSGTSAWEPVAVGADVTNTLTTKGDLLGRTSSAATRLAVGNNGETLVADSSTSTGLRYNPPVGSLAQPVINGGMDVWQRGTSFSVGAAAIYTADRWYAYRGGLATGETVSRQTTSDTTNLPFIQYAARVQRDSGNTSTQSMNLQYSMETANSLPFAGRTVTLSFYARRGANFSESGGSQLTSQLFYGTGTDQNIGGTYTGATAVISTTVTLTTTWQRFALTGTIASTATELALSFGYTPTGTAGANDWFEITGVQIDLGTYTSSTAPAFRRSGGTIQGELAAASRYYQKSYNTDVAPGTASAAGLQFGSQVASTTSAGILAMQITFNTTMRTNATVTTYDNSGNSGVCGRDTIGVGGDVNQPASLTQQSNKGFVLYGSGTNRAGLSCHYTASAEL